MTELIAFAKLLLLIAFCYLAGACLFARDRTDAGLVMVWFTAGLCLLSVLFLLSKIMNSVAVAFALLPVLLLAWLHRKPELTPQLGYRPGELGVAFATVVAASLPVFIMGARMGAGEFPPVFFAGDSPYFLHHAHAIASAGSYPPPSFEVYGLSFKYHYGAQAFVALSGLLTGLKRHFVYFVILEPLMTVLLGMFVYDISRRITGRHGTALFCLVLVLFGSRQYFVNYFDPSNWAFVTAPEHFNFRYPNLPSITGLVMALAIVRCVIEFDRRNQRLAALLLLVALPAFKIPYLIPIGAGLAFIYLYELRKRFEATLLIEILGAALLSLVSFLLFSYSPFAGKADTKANVLGFLDMMAPWQQQTMLVFGILAIATAAVTRARPSEGLTRLLLIAMSPYVLFSLCSLENLNENQSQIFDLAVSLAVLFTAIYVVSAWTAGGRQQGILKPALAVVTVGWLIGPAMASLANHVRIVALHPEKGHEFVDNRMVADALQHIPLESSLIATNDVRYPANDYDRGYRQFQLAGIYGHRNLASNIVYGGIDRTELNYYLALLRLFQERKWPQEEMERLKKTWPVTHLLIHKHYAHADKIPLALVYENRDYAVYRF